MTILCLGLSHHTAPVALRERVSLPAPALKALLSRFGCGHLARPAGLQELVVLSTCNRLELYALAKVDTCEPLVDLVAETTGVPRDEFAGSLYCYRDEEAVTHLCRVAAGLDSMVLGEPQILGQVTDAYAAAVGQGAAGTLLAGLFRTAIRAGRRARTETGISRNPASISSVAVRRAEELVGDLTAAQVLVVGAGQMADLAVAALRARCVSGITVISRTLEHAQELAQRWEGRALPFERLPQALAAADIVIASTGAPHLLIQPDHARTAMAARPARPLVFLDIALPRDVDPEVTQIPHVHCYDLDDLQSYLHQTVSERAREVPRVDAIIAEEAQEYLAWLRALDIRPVIADLRARADTIRRAEVEKTLRRMPDLTPEQRRRIEALSEALVNKLLHEPTYRLRAEAGNGHAAQYAEAVRELFGLMP